LGLNDTVELAGPDPIRMDELVRRFLSANGDPRKVITDVHARYHGIEVNDQSLVPGDDPASARRFRGLAQPLLTDTWAWKMTRTAERRTHANHT
jgi:hypothetical protein